MRQAHEGKASAAVVAEEATGTRAEKAKGKSEKGKLCRLAKRHR